MGEVYRARDLRLGRDVALKFLPDSVADDEGRLRRFEREAKLLASLNHPGIATLYGFEHANDSPFLVMEVVEGPTLADRLQRGCVPWREAAGIGRQIAEALEAAHEQGIVHRDLKPANVKVSPDGRVKLLDFGLGRALGAKSAASEVKVHTETSPTDVGIILGTAPYMSPEQARGQPVDHRSDVWAFGCVFYELLTGQRAFSGPTASDVVAGILEHEPDWAALPHDTPPLVRALLRRCLTKDPFRRLHAIADARIELDEALAPVLEHRAPRPSTGVQNLAIAATALLVLAAVAASVWLRPHSATPTRHASTRLNLSLGSYGQELATDVVQPSIALSPDGRHLAYVASGGGIYMRSLDRVAVRLLPGTESGSHPFFSPDGKWIGFAAGGMLQKISVDGGSPRAIAEAVDPRGASWGVDGTIIYTPDPWAGLYRVSAEGGAAQKLTEPDPETEASHRWPQFLPDGQTVLFTIQPLNTTVRDSRIAALSLTTSKKTSIAAGGTYGRYVPTGHLVYANDGTLFAAPFDLDQLQVGGAAIPLVEGIRMHRQSNAVGTGVAQFEFSESGRLAYAAPHWQPRLAQLSWMDRDGSATPVTPTVRAFDVPRISPDGRRLVVAVDDGAGSRDLWLFEIVRRTWLQLTFGGYNNFADWSPRGDRLVFVSNRAGAGNLFVVSADGGAVTRLTTDKHSQSLPNWSPDGRTVLFAQYHPGSLFDLWEVEVEGGRPPRSMVVGQGIQNEGSFSPDGRWLVYGANNMERSAASEGEVFVSSYTAPDRKWSISAEGGSQPRWTTDGKEVIYTSRQSNAYKMWTVPVKLGATFHPGVARVLFERKKELISYDLAPDGQRFVVAEALEAAADRPHIVFVPDWFEELKAKVPVPK